MDQAAKEPRHFDMIEVNGQTVSRLASQPRASLLSQFEPGGKPPAPTIRIRDTVSVSIWQSTNEQVLLPRQMAPEQGGGSISFPDQVVAADGAISVPYAGRIPAAGRTPVQVQATIEQRLAEQIIRPQALAVVTKTTSNSATIFGEDISGARIPLSPGGDRLLDLIASAGGTKSPFYATSIRLSRSGQTATIPMTTLVSDPQENIYVWPGDIITIINRPEQFSVRPSPTRRFRSAPTSSTWRRP
jgi:polysaccharide export outer membrane protein